MTDRDADADIIAAGPEPRGPLLRPGRLVWLLVLVEAMALAVSVAVAVHYRAEVRRLQSGPPPTVGLATSLPAPELGTVALALPADGTVTGTVVITAAALPGADLVQFTVSAVITGGQPGTVYDLDGNDCSSTAPITNHVWATGVTGADGTADLVGYAWTGALADQYWLTLDPSPVNPPPGLHGQFAEARAAPFPAGQAPCAPWNPSPLGRGEMSKGVDAAVPVRLDPGTALAAHPDLQHVGPPVTRDAVPDLEARQV